MLEFTPALVAVTASVGVFILGMEALLGALRASHLPALVLATLSPRIRG